MANCSYDNDVIVLYQAQWCVTVFLEINFSCSDLHLSP